MANGGGLFDAGAQVIAANRAKKGAQQTLRDARENRDQGLAYAAGLDWEPELISDHVPTYQRSTSPIADAFLQSLLTGSNPGLVQGTRNGAPQLKAAAQRNFDQETGGFDQLRARQREMEASTPWAGTPFSGPRITPEDQWGRQAPGLAKAGITPSGNAALGEAGYNLDPMSAKLKSGKLAPYLVSPTKTIWGTELNPQQFAQISTALESGDTDLAMNILKGSA